MQDSEEMNLIKMKKAIIIINHLALLNKYLIHKY